jgi:hypothetical protein
VTHAFRLPKTLTLPSGARVTLEERSLRASALPEASDAPMLFSDALALLRERVALLSESRELDVFELSLADFHVVRAILTKAALLEEDEVTVSCLNCDAELSTRPCAGLETGPWEDGELNDDELDRLAPFGEALELPPLELGHVRTVRSITLQPRTVKEALPLWRAGANPPLVLDEAVVEALGIEALGPIRSPARIAEALHEAGPDAHALVFEAFLAAHYPLRLACDVICPACQARNTVDAPFVREVDLEALPRGAHAEGAEHTPTATPLPSFEDFVARAHAMAARHLAALPGERVVLLIDDGTPAVDDGGAPLLGSYVPPPPADALVPMHPPTVTIYYRTFLRIEDEEGLFDWEDELRETIEHELEHHVYFLRGDDPMDAEERAEIEHEKIRIVGRREAERRTRRELVQSAAGFLLQAWPLLAIVALALALVLAQERCD